jgi:hypothetical protein
MAVYCSQEECINLLGRPRLPKFTRKNSVKIRPIKTVKLCKVSWGFANLIVDELKAIGAVVDPKFKPRTKRHLLGPGQKTSIVHKMFLLSLRTLHLAGPWYCYLQKELEQHFAKSVSYQCIANWFHKHWDHEGNLSSRQYLFCSTSGSSKTKFATMNSFRSFKFSMIIRNTTFWTRNMFGTRMSTPTTSW